MSAAAGHQLWPAPAPGRPVDATVVVPGSKSVTNRALVLAALAGGTSGLPRPLESRDTVLMAGALRVLGLAVAHDPGTEDILVIGKAGPFAPTGDAIDLGNAGTVARFLPPLAALADGSITFDGDPRMRERPIGTLVTALRDLGADIDDG